MFENMLTFSVRFFQINSFQVTLLCNIIFQKGILKMKFWCKISFLHTVVLRNGRSHLLIYFKMFWTMLVISAMNFCIMCPLCPFFLLDLFSTTKNNNKTKQNKTPLNLISVTLIFWSLINFHWYWACSFEVREMK